MLCGPQPFQIILVLCIIGAPILTYFLDEVPMASPHESGSSSPLYFAEDEEGMSQEEWRSLPYGVRRKIVETLFLDLEAKVDNKHSVSPVPLKAKWLTSEYVCFFSHYPKYLSYLLG